MNISLTTELEAMVQDKVRSGLYASASEVIREALRLFEEQERLRQLRFDDLRKQIAVGIEQIERGDVAPLDLAAIKARGGAHRKATR